MNELLKIYISFFKIGILTFGGGYSMLPMLQKELVESRGWATNEEVIDLFAVAQCLPGIIAINTATLVGRKVRGVRGGLAAALGVISPSFLIIVIIAAFIQNFIEYTVVQNAFFGIRIAVAALILDAIIKLWKTGIHDLLAFIIFAITFTVSLVFKISSVYLVILAVTVGILSMKIRERKKGADSGT